MTRYSEQTRAVLHPSGRRIEAKIVVDAYLWIEIFAGSKMGIGSKRN